MIPIKTPVILVLTIASWTVTEPALGGVSISQSCVRDYLFADMLALQPGKSKKLNVFGRNHSERISISWEE